MGKMELLQVSLRIPGSLNSKRIQFNDEETYHLKQKSGLWTGNRPSIRSLLMPYYIWLQAAAIKDAQRRRKAEQKYSKYHRRHEDKNSIAWIEKLTNL
jgi:hypothetical protein